jgi:hypothetical protein
MAGFVLGQAEWSALSLVRGLEGEPAPSRILLDPKKAAKSSRRKFFNRKILSQKAL